MSIEAINNVFVVDHFGLSFAKLSSEKSCNTAAREHHGVRKSTEEMKHDMNCPLIGKTPKRLVQRNLVSLMPLTTRSMAPVSLMFGDCHQLHCSVSKCCRFVEHRISAFWERWQGLISFPLIKRPVSFRLLYQSVHNGTASVP